jgi:hypothetical protein
MSSYILFTNALNSSSVIAAIFLYFLTLRSSGFATLAAELIR